LQVTTASQYILKLVTKEDYDKYSRYLNKGKSDRYKQKEKNGASHDRSDDVEKSCEKDKRKPTSARDASPDAKKPKTCSDHDAASRWACPLLRVKIIDRKYKDGRYYSSKVIVEDVLPDGITCRTSSGRLLEG